MLWDWIAVIIAGLTTLWVIYRDSSDDSTELLERIHVLETTVTGHSSKLDRLEKETGELQDSISKLDEKIHRLDIKIERILAILERDKGQ